MNSILNKLFYIFLFAFLSSLTNAKQVEKSTSNAPYKGTIYNIFFHPLIAYPDLAFDPKNSHLEYIDSWFVTTREFNKIIPELYEKGFVLVSPKDLFEEKTDKQGRIIITQKAIYLPRGKKPLILSLDDYNYYPNMKLHGTIHRFWVDTHNNLATITHHDGQPTIIRYDQEVPQLLESFIAKHPDFSYHNARGIFALTGYNGIFGYDTNQLLYPNYQIQLKNAKKVVRKLKEMGWEFASHSYFHKSIDKLPEKPFEISEKRWKKEVGSLVGPTSYYIFPFGDSWNKIPKRMDFLKSLGYKYFFGISSSQQFTIEPGAVIMYRFPMDGLSLRGRYRSINVFISSPAKVFDSDRPLHIKNGN